MVYSKDPSLVYWKTENTEKIHPLGQFVEITVYFKYNTITSR